MIEELSAVIKTQKELLDTLAPGSPEARRLRSEIGASEKLVQSMWARVAENRVDEERRAKHAEILPQCRTLAQRYLEIKSKFARQNDAVVEAFRGEQRAQRARWEAERQRPLDESYPSQNEMQRWKNSVRERERAVEKALESYRSAVTKRDATQNELLDVQQRLADVVFRERNLRPRVPEETFTLQVRRAW